MMTDDYSRMIKCRSDEMKRILLNLFPDCNLYLYESVVSSDVECKTCVN